ncbi:C40 family peptidase [Pseudonocardia spinosispora]|uniref:C40 family peptidase n=1 Tax=Pseudonocardia spinosispora TaxID=103441 RepID=UPI000419B0FB|nr:C40 family peptidase [Pseudonocardia spinosispora]
MRTAGYRGGAPLAPAPRDLTRTAVLIGVALTAVVVLVVTLSGLFGPRREAVSASPEPPVTSAGHRAGTPKTSDEDSVTTDESAAVPDLSSMVDAEPVTGTETTGDAVSRPLPACTRQVSDATRFQTAVDDADADEVICIMSASVRAPLVRPGAATALAFARAQLGKDYVWGGNGAEDGGFDCSGLTTAAFAAAGVHLPRTAQTQYNAGPRLSRNQQIQAGDLVFFGSGPRSITHVGLAVSSTQMINAPQTGEVIKVGPIHRKDFIGATRPARPTEDPID